MNDPTAQRAIEILDQAGARAVGLIEKAKQEILDRDKKYNGGGIKFSDYQLFGPLSMWTFILEQYGRLWSSRSPDKAVDWTAYTALQAALIEAGVPQSDFKLPVQALLASTGEKRGAGTERHDRTSNNVVG